MKKRISAIIMILVICFSFSVPAFATETIYVVDQSGTLTDKELKDLNELGETLANSTGCDILYAFIDDEDIDLYAIETDLGKCANGILMVENDNVWNIYTYGEPKYYIDDNDVDALRDAFEKGDDANNAENLFKSVSAYMHKANEIVKENSSSLPSESSISENSNVTVQNIGGYNTTVGKNNTLILENRTRVVDMAELMDESEKSSLLSKLDEISERQKLDVVVLTVDTLDGKTPEEYADDFFDYNNYGFGDNKDGVLLLVSMEDRDWHISTKGYGITAITDKGIEYISDQFLPKLSDGDYYESFVEYANQCDKFITQARTGEPYDVGNMPKEPFPVVSAVVMGLVIGLVVAFIVTFIMKGNLKTVQMQNSASDYVRKGSMKVTKRQDAFLYSHVSKTRRETQSSGHSGGGGSSTHISSSGSSHGGGGGKF
ncbi:MAG: TPM domain-containing protein [Clostridia bacterium]|nr:TPM domain-containing protein [Clostridia bacterium]